VGCGLGALGVAKIHINWYLELAWCIAAMVGIVDPATTTSISTTIDRIMAEMEFIN
jgi:hypothetical protein